MKKKILIFVESDLYIRNYFTFNSFDLPEYDVVIYASEGVTQRHILFDLNNFRGFLHEDPKRAKLRTRQSAIQMLKFIKLSKSFYFRFKRSRPSSIAKLKLKIACSPILFNMINYFIKLKLKENTELKNIIIKEGPDLVVIPSQVVGSISLDLIEICNNLSIKTLFLIDGWDNISSKTVFPLHPTYLAVWGQQSVEYAVKIQNFPKERIFTIGTPRFDSYFLPQDKSEKLFDFQYVIFTGCAIPFDEITALRILDYCLIKNNIKDIKIIYRPHPWRQKRNCFDYFIKEDYKNVILDKQMEGYYYCNQIMGVSNALQPSLEYYPLLIKNSLFTISPLTTMIIEAAIMNKYVLTLTYDDHYHFTNPLNALKNYEHFEGIERISAFKFCYDYKDLSRIFLSLLNEVQTSKKNNNFKKELNYIIEITNDSYSQRLNKIIKKIFNN